MTAIDLIEQLKNKILQAGGACRVGRTGEAEDALGEALDILAELVAHVE